MPVGAMEMRGMLVRQAKGVVAKARTRETRPWRDRAERLALSLPAETFSP